MNSQTIRKHLVTAALLLLGVSLATYTFASSKKGVGLAKLDEGDRIDALNVAWYYTWKPYPIANVPNKEFVPMISGGRGGALFAKHLAAQRQQGTTKYLLTFNEPDKADQANKTVDEVISLWPELEKLGAQISTPAAAGVMGSWFDEFYRRAKQRKLKVHFMAVHLYTPPEPRDFLARIDAVYDKYRMPIWITEFAVADWTAKNRHETNKYSEQQVLDFMKAVLPELEKRPYVIRYAWFGAGPTAARQEQVRTSRLFEVDDSLTSLGQYYAAFRWPPPKDH